MKVHVQKQNNGGRFIAMEDEEEAGIMIYSMADDFLMLIDHTEVNPDYRGQGIGKVLLMNLVDYARDHNYNVIPQCPFAKSLFQEEEKIKDVLR
ncbi:N-acetyltransferase [Echinicola pacifica]|uniref:N-acetyltransferase n=1 Tax=Echinicola pacifica TaxID=346377 RepID=A0A918PLV3_9BACT|nr:GNAT family N-acetyltransferase [Echinicola pacifica]GGZ14640.1 N-acetyltransferase [Echinicola pacifica]